MSDVYEHNPGDHEDPLPGPTWIVGILGAVLLAVIMLGLTALYYNAQMQEVTEKVVLRDPDELVNLRTAQEAMLTEKPRIIETLEPDAQGNMQKSQAIVIPIEQAMELMVKEHAK